MARVLIACEESQAVTKEFRNLGIEAYSCDILETSGENPEWHYRCDVRDVINQNWDMVIAFPPCTDLATSGAKHFAKKRESGVQQASIEFFLLFTKLQVKYVAIENPIGIMSTVYRKPDQIINPYQFGHSVNKKTCLWLKSLPLLKPTNIVEKDEFIVFPSGKKMSKFYYETSCLPHNQRSLARSKTFHGIAKAMAEQWGAALDG